MTATTGSRVRAAGSLAVAQLRHHRVRTVLAVVGVSLAVLATVLLGSLGVSVVEAGSSGLESIGADVWLTSGSVTFAPGAVGGVHTDLQDAHPTTAEVESRDDVAAARALHFQTVYVGTDPGEYRTVVGTGVTGDGSSFNVAAGRSFAAGDRHYANGTYDGPMSGEVLVDRETADRLGVSVGDTVHAGGTLTAARRNTFTVVGISNDVSGYVGTPSVVFHLAELQTISSTTRTDPASAIVVAVEDDADAAAVAADLREAYPDLEVRTADEQFRSVLRSQSLVVGSAAAIAALAFAIGVAIVANVFGLLVYQQRRQFAALRATGVSTGTLLAAVFVQGVLVGTAGGAVGVAAAVPGTIAINRAVAHVVGFEDLVELPSWILAGGFGVALAVGVAGALVAGWLLSGVEPRHHLQP